MEVCFQRAGMALMCSVIAASAAFAQGAKTDTTKAAAQGGAKACDAMVATSDALARGTFSLDRAFRALQGQRDASKDLKDAIRALTTPPKTREERADSIGRAYYLGQAYILMLQVPGVKAIGRRGDYGIATDTVLSIDLLAAADTAFTKAEPGLPACKGEIVKWRQQKPWLDLLNTAITAMNAGQFDTAAVLAKRTLVIDRSTPYPYSIMANAANNRKDYAAATADLKQVLVVAGTDTAYNDVRLSTISQLAATATQLANATTGPDKKDRVQEAITDWQNFIPMGSRDVQVANGEQMIVQLYKSVGDSSKISEAYSQIIANPSKFGEQTLLNGGVIATRARKPDDAAKLFAAVLDQNPNQRDALNNLAANYVEGKDVANAQKMLPLVDRLVTLDPNNPENWRLYAYAYSVLLKSTKDTKQVKAYTDSLVKYNNKADKMTTIVSLTEFSHTEKATTLSGTVQNLGKTTQSYTMNIDFLDKSGAVINSQTANVGPVAAKDSGTFTVTAPVAGIVAFRYKPLS
jgi:tetratricopeptide (TPR) repeat protein